MRLRVVLAGCAAAVLLLAAIRSDAPQTLKQQSVPASDAAALGASASPVITCGTHVEPSVARFDPKRDLIRGPFALVTIKRELPRLSGASYRPNAGRLPVVKIPVGLRSGHRATLR